MKIIWALVLAVALPGDVCEERLHKSWRRDPFYADAVAATKFCRAWDWSPRKSWPIDPRVWSLPDQPHPVVDRDATGREIFWVLPGNRLSCDEVKDALVFFAQGILEQMRGEKIDFKKCDVAGCP